MQIFNLITSIGAFGVQVIYFFAAFTAMLSYAFNSVPCFTWTMIWLLSTLACWIVALIQGIRSSSNGKARTIFSAAIMNLVMYFMDAIMVCLIITNKGKSYQRWTGASFQSAGVKFLVVFVVMILLSVIKIVLAKKYAEDEKEIRRSSLTAKLLIVFLVIIPLAAIGLLIVGIEISRHPEWQEALNKFAAGIGIVGFVVIIGCFIYLFRTPIAGAAELFGAFADFSAEQNEKNRISAEKSRKSREEEKIKGRIEWLKNDNEANAKGLKGKAQGKFGYGHVDEKRTASTIRKNNDEIERLKKKL